MKEPIQPPMPLEIAMQFAANHNVGVEDLIRTGAAKVLWDHKGELFTVPTKGPNGMEYIDERIASIVIGDRTITLFNADEPLDIG